MRFTEQLLRDRIEAGFCVGPTTTTSRGVTGEPYVRIGCQLGGISKIPGTIDEGSRGVMGLNVEMAWEIAVNSFQLYAKGRGRNLYWRQLPALEWDDTHTKCHFYLRLLVSNAMEECLSNVDKFLIGFGD